MLNRKPCVYLVGNDYQIVFNMDCFGIAWLEVAGENFPDEENGLMRNETTTHKIVVPANRLDQARGYAVCFRALPERKPYWPETGETERYEFNFHPINEKENLNIYHIADAHSHAEEAVAAGSYFGDKLDLLILNGDIPAESKTEKDVLTVFDIAGGITGGEKPVLFARGNHDTRGKYALEFTNSIGTDAGNTYFTFRTGGLWGIVLDCGEDKEDASKEYGGLVCSRPFRRRQIDFLKRVLDNRAREFDAPGVKTRLAVCHVPFMTDLLSDDPRFDIEKEVYGEWTRLLSEMGIDLMLCGHMHTLHMLQPGDDQMRYGANFPVLVGSMPVFYKQEEGRPNRLVGAALELKNGEMSVNFTDNFGWKEEAIRLNARSGKAQ